MGRARINIIDSTSNKKLKIHFNDVAGLHEAKTEIREFVDYLRNPTRYTVNFFYFVFLGSCWKTDLKNNILGAIFTLFVFF